MFDITKLFRSKAEKELDFIIDEMKNNLENNYKDTAQEAREKLGRRSKELFDQGLLKEKDYRKYKYIYDRYTEMLRGYHH